MGGGTFMPRCSAAGCAAATFDFFIQNTLINPENKHKLLIVMDANEFEAAKKSVVSQLKKIPEVKAIYLFGSYATGKQKPISDI